MSNRLGILIPHFQFEYVHEFKVTRTRSLRLSCSIRPAPPAVEGSDVAGFMTSGWACRCLRQWPVGLPVYEKLLGQQGTSKDSIAIGIRIEF